MTGTTCSSTLENQRVGSGSPTQEETPNTCIHQLGGGGDGGHQKFLGVSQITNWTGQTTPSPRLVLPEEAQVLQLGHQAATDVPPIPSCQFHLHR